MSLQTRLIAYWAVLHLLILVLTLYLYEELGLWVLLVEAALIINAFAGWRLIKKVVEPLQFLESGVKFIEGEEFTARFTEVGQVEMDRLIETYNRMLASLQDQRIKTGEQRGILERLLQATPVGVIALDFEGAISIVNPAAARFLGGAPEALVGLKLTEASATLGPRLEALTRDAAEVLPVQGGRRLRCLRSFFHDRSFKRDFLLIEELTEELRQSERAAYGKLIRMMSHEVNNTVGSANSLLGSIRLLKDRLAGADQKPFTEALDAVIQRNSNLDRFMRGFADVIRLPDPQPEPTDMVELIRGIARLCEVQMQERNIEWVESYPEMLPKLRLDAHLMEQVLLNVIRNAMDAIGENGTITAKVERSYRGWVLEIIDSGNALTPEVEYQIFTPFFTTKKTGQGIGLTLCAEILSRHGFDYSLAPGEDGRTHFRIEMPINAPASVRSSDS